MVNWRKTKQTEKVNYGLQHSGLQKRVRKKNLSAKITSGLFCVPNQRQLVVPVVREIRCALHAPSRGGAKIRGFRNRGKPALPRVVQVGQSSRPAGSAPSGLGGAWRHHATLGWLVVDLAGVPIHAASVTGLTSGVCDHLIIGVFPLFVLHRGGSGLRPKHPYFCAPHAGNKP